MPNLSETAQSLITLLNNINELIVLSSDRKSAKEVMSAFRIYANGKNFLIQQDKIDNFFAVLLDARPYTLTMLVKDIADDVLSNDIKSKRTNFKKIEK